jgi:site-specific DNA-methyltransferase (adenine-specific)
LEDNSIDLIFADPPFNLDKLYPSNIDDHLKEEEYLIWQEKWLSECVRILKHGGALYLWNLPKWNTYNSYFLNKRLKFRNWISVDIKYSLPIPGRFYPSHYSLLYYIKGEKPNTFHPDRLPMEICPNCQTDLRDYGGYKDKMNPNGVNLSDVWYDIPPVRHSKYKRRKGANELPIKLLDRIIECSSEEDDLIFDPFGGSGTTYIVSEIKKRRWIGVEIGPVDDIIQRFNIINEERDYLQTIRSNLNCLFTKKSLQYRVRNGLWTPESVRTKKKELMPSLFASD